MANQSTLTGLAAVLFVVGIGLLLTAIFRNADHGGGLMIWVGLAALAGTIGCWFAAARAGNG